MEKFKSLFTFDRVFPACLVSFALVLLSIVFASCQEVSKRTIASEQARESCELECAEFGGIRSCRVPFAVCNSGKVQRHHGAR